MAAAAPIPVRSGSSRALLLVIVLLVVVLGGVVGAVMVLRSTAGQRFLAAHLPAGIARLAGVTSPESQASAAVPEEHAAETQTSANESTAGSPAAREQSSGGSQSVSEAGASASGSVAGAATAAGGAVAAEVGPAPRGQTGGGLATGSTAAEEGRRQGVTREGRQGLASSGAHVSSSEPGVSEGRRRREERAAPAALSGVAYAVTGEPLLAGSVGSILASELAAAGLEAVDAQTLPATEGALRSGGEPSAGELIDLLRSAGVATLVLARVDHVGDRDLNYMGRHDVAYSSRVTVTCYDIATGRPVGRSNTATVEYTQLNVERQAEKTVAPLAGAAAASLGRR